VTLIWTKALLVLSGMQLSMVSSMLNSLVTIIGIATVMHITLRFREQRFTKEPVEALRQTMLELTVPIFWTIATTAAGFAAVMTSSIAPVASFGIMMTLATLIVLVTCGMVLPGGILIGETGQVPGRAPAEAKVTRALGRLTVWVDRQVTRFIRNSSGWSRNVGSQFSCPSRTRPGFSDAGQRVCR
jgi:predicted RND superfamily exporter protein